MISIIQLGAVDYSTGLRLQEQLVALRKEGKMGDVLLLLEHLPVITLGRNAKAANVVASRELLAQRGVALFECDRGGDVTFHGPGQIVGYPIFDLRGFRVGADAQACPEPSVGAEAILRPGESQTCPSILSRGGGHIRPPGRVADSPFKTLGVVEFVRRLEEVLIRTCADFSIPAKRIPGLTGVWTDDASAGPNSLSFRAQQEDSLANLPAESRNMLSSASETQAHAESKLAAADTTHVGTGALARPDESKTRLTPSLSQHSGPESKLAAIGVHVSRFVTSHGFALNVNTDLSYFDLIVPCGITSKPVTSMQRELGRPLDLNSVAESISRNLGIVFQNQIRWVETLDALLGHTVGVPMKPPADLRRLHKDDDTTWA